MVDIRVKDLNESVVPGADYYVLTDSATDGVKKVKTTNIVSPTGIGAATAAQGSRADTAVQPGDLSLVAKSGSYNDLSGKPSLGALAAKNSAAISDISAIGAPSASTALFGDGTWRTPLGSGDMVKSSYDPRNVNADAFNSANHSFIHSFTGAVSRPALLKMREVWSVRDAGAIGDGLADDSAAFQKLANEGIRVLVPDGNFRIVTPVTLTNGSIFEGYGANRSKIVAATAGQHLFEGVDCGKLSFSGLGLSGYGASSTLPLVGVGGQGQSTTGLASFVRCADVRIIDCELSGFYSGATNLYCDRVWIERTYVHNWYVYGALASTSRQWWIDRNVFKDCDQTGASNAYACSATGADYTNADMVRSGSFSFNHVENVASWDGFMSHAARNLRLVGNRMKNVRMGFDISHYDTTDGIIIALNDIEGPATDAWAGAAAASGAIKFSTDYASRQPTSGDVIIANNRANNFFNLSGLTPSGTSDVIEIMDVDRASVQGNIIANCGAQTGIAGIGVYGTNKVVSLRGNILDGKFSAGGIRTNGATIGDLIIDGNSITQTVSSDIGVYVDSGSLIQNLAIGSNPTNSTSPVLISGTVSTKYSGAGHPLSAIASYGGGTFAAGTSSGPGTLTVAGAAMGDLFTASYSADLQGMTLNVWQTSAGSFTYKFVNGTSGSVTLSAGTVRVRVLKGA